MFDRVLNTLLGLALKWFGKIMWLILLGHYRDKLDWDGITDMNKLWRNCREIANNLNLFTFED